MLNIRMTHFYLGKENKIDFYGVMKKKTIYKI